MTTFRVPPSICDHLYGILAQLWWSSTSSIWGMSLTQRYELHVPKGVGGLGILCLMPFNQDLLANQAWWIMHHPQLFLSRVFTMKYVSLRHFRSIVSDHRMS